MNAKARRAAKRQMKHRVPAFVTIMQAGDIQALKTRVASGQITFLGDVKRVSFAGNVFVRFGNEEFASKQHGIIRAGSKGANKLAVHDKCVVRVDKIDDSRTGKPMIKLSFVSTVSNPVAVAKTAAKPKQGKSSKKALDPATEQATSRWGVLAVDTDSDSDSDSDSDGDNCCAKPEPQPAKPVHNNISDIIEDEYSTEPEPEPMTSMKQHKEIINMTSHTAAATADADDWENLDLNSIVLVTN